jgi:calcineurin-like phosphoesterase
MKILLIGDVVAKPGRTAVLDRLQDLREQHALDLVVLTPKTSRADSRSRPRWASSCSPAASM